MTIKTGKRCNETHRNQARMGAQPPETARGRGRGTVISTLLASAVAAVMILALAPTSFALAPIAPGFSGEPGPHKPTPTKTADGARTSSTSSPTPTMSGDMPGMDHGSGDAPESSPKPTMSGDMPDMDHGSGHAPESSPKPTMSGDMPGMEHGPGGAPEADHGSGDAPMGGHETGVPAEESARPLAAVLGTFGVGSGAVMVSAGALRHRDRARNRIKAAARAARRSQS